jgi:hypothetical protein
MFRKQAIRDGHILLVPAVVPGLVAGDQQDRRPLGREVPASLKTANS